jgi:hypothetical protein
VQSLAPGLLLLGLPLSDSFPLRDTGLSRWPDDDDVDDNTEVYWAMNLAQAGPSALHAFEPSLKWQSAGCPRESTSAWPPSCLNSLLEHRTTPGSLPLWHAEAKGRRSLGPWP